MTNEETRLFLLEDPFDFEGARGGDLQYILDSLRRIIENLPPHRFLIVTSKLSSLPKLNNQLVSNEGYVAGHIWYDLSVKDLGFLQSFWNYYTNNESHKTIWKKLYEGLKLLNENDLLQPGQLLHLSRTPNTENADFETLCGIAKFDIEQLARKLEKRTIFSRKVHSALCLGSTTVQSIKLQDLQFILSDSDLRPTFNTDIGVSYSVGNALEKEVFPGWPEIPNLANEIMAELEYLEISGHIRILNQAIIFAHPDYLFASKKILLNFPMVNLNYLITMFERALSCLNEDIPLLTLCSIQYFFEKHSPNMPDGKIIYPLVHKTLNSIFPSVRDAAIELLIKWFNYFNIEEQETILLQIHVVGYDYNSILWNGDIPWTSSDRVLEIPFDWDPDLKQDPVSKEILNNIIDPKQQITVKPKDAWRLSFYLGVIEQNRSTEKALLELMKFPYTFIRAKAIRTLAKHHLINDSSLIDILFQKDHPGVIVNCIYEIFSNWYTFPVELQIKIQSKLAEVISDPAVAVAISSFLTNFGEPYSSNAPNWESITEPDKRKIWALWAQIFEIYLKTLTKLPFRHNRHHTYRTLKQAISQLETSALVKLMYSLSDWIDGQLKLRILDEFELPICELIMQVDINATERVNFLRNLLAQTDTSYIIITLTTLIDEWENLVEKEKVLVLELFRNTRKDVRWLKATAITRPLVPREILLELTNMSELLPNCIETIIERIPKQLFTDALHVYCGKPRLFNTYCLDHAKDTIWHSVVEFVASNPTHADFELTLNEILYNAFLYTEFREPLALWNQLCSTSDLNLRKVLFDSLLRVSVDINGPVQFGFWKILFRSMDDNNEINRYVQIIIRYLFKISNNVDDLSGFFGKEEFTKYILPQLTIEVQICDVCRSIEANILNAVEIKNCLMNLKSILQYNMPRLVSIYSKIKRVIENIFTQEAYDLLTSLEEIRQTALKTDLEETFVDEIKDWFFSYDRDIRRTYA